MIDNATKFDRRYTLKVESGPRTPYYLRKVVDPRIPSMLRAPTTDFSFETIELPYTCEFSITRNLLASANTATFRILNLAENSRNRIYKDQYTMLDFHAIQFWAGYSDQPPMVFNGNVLSARSYKDSGGTNVITEIEAYEGMFAMVNGFSSQSVPGGSSYAGIIESLNGDLPHLDTPTIGGIVGAATRGTALFGNTWKLIQDYSRGLATIDNNRLLVLQPWECLLGDIQLINAETGLLGSPSRSQALVECELVFTPQLKVGQIIRLESSINKYLNGEYKVAGFSHSGTISPAVSGTARTRVQLWLGSQALKTL